MLNFIDNFLNKITMYRLVLYALIFFFGGALSLSFFNFLPYSPIDLASSLLVILIVSYVTNLIFGYFFEAPTNVESIYITAFILFFIITPVQAGNYAQFLPLAIWASVWAMASKYIFAIGRKHIFNPAAVGVVITALIINESASWWVGTPAMLPFVFLGGVLVVRKLRHFDMLIGYTIAGSAAMILFALLKGGNAATPISILNTMILTVKNSSFFFFISIMLTEPLTSPTTKWWRIAFGALVGFLSAPAIHVGSFYSTPELALVTGNLFAYIVSPKEKLFLKLKDREEIGTDTYNFVFENARNKKLNFKPGQYMEWTLNHRRPDSRGNRRYFTLASSPTENDIHLGVKFYPNEKKTSSFKNRLLALPRGGEIVAAQTSGDFVLPKNKSQELVFIAGGIGITPFRSMIKYLLDKNEKRDITLLYSNKKVADVSYKEIFDEAKSKLGIKTVYVITDKGEMLTDSSMYTGMISPQMIRREIPNYKNKIFYISGPHSMVNSFEKTLRSMGIHKRNIKIDFFPGFA